MNRFRIGDRVRVRSTQYYDVPMDGVTGTVISFIASGDPFVEFDFPVPNPMSSSQYTACSFKINELEPTTKGRR